MEAQERFSKPFQEEAVAVPSTGAVAAQLQLLVLAPRRGGSFG